MRLMALAAVLSLGCNSDEVGWSSANGVNVVVVSIRADGTPARCWALRRTFISHEPSGADGIFWRGPTGNYVHIYGSFMWVKVKGDDWNRAYADVGLTQSSCASLAEAH